MLIFRDGEEILIQSRDEKPLNRYFPEVVETLQTQLVIGNQGHKSAYGLAAQSKQ